MTRFNYISALSAVKVKEPSYGRIVYICSDLKTETMLFENQTYY